MLLDDILAHQPVDAIEAAHRDSFIALLSKGDQVFARSHFDPGHVTASAFIIDPPRHAILLHHHRRLGRWLQMGGHVEPGESVRDAALREAREESGLRDLQFFVEPLIDLDVHEIPAARGEPSHRHFDVRYLVFTRDPESLVADEAESIALQWFSFAEAAGKMGGAESLRVLQKIELLLSRHAL